MSDKKIVIYTQPGCSACGSAKAYLRELTEKYNSNSTPTILVDGEVIIGFDKEKPNSLLSQSHKLSS